MQTYSIIYLQCLTRKIIKIEADSYESVIGKLSFRLIELSMVSSVKDEQGTQLWTK